MFHHLPQPNRLIPQPQPQSGSYPPYYPNIPESQHLNNWLRWECHAWQPNILNFSQIPLSSCKIEEPEPIHHLSMQAYESEKVKKQQGILQPREGKGMEEDIRMSLQKKAIYLARKGYLSELQKDELKKYRCMRVEGYLSKKAKRTFEKKIVYTTRKRVADRRIRFKGKFINEYQARELLGISGPQHSFEELKAMMKQLKPQS